jgi:flagellar biosynthesis protein FliP
LRAIATSAFAFAPAAALAHEPSELAKQRMLEGSFTDVVWLGAEHMLTGYDHILFLLGVMFFLTRWQQIVTFITAFTLGHTVVLLIATPLGIKANPYVIDAIIALTVIYKAFVLSATFDGYTQEGRRAFSYFAKACAPVRELLGDKKRGGSVCLNSLAGLLSGSPTGDHAAARSGWWKYISSGVRQPRLECGRTLL